MEKPKKSTSKITPRLRKIKAKSLSFYYGNPIKDMKLIAVTGTTGSATTAHFIHEILISSNDRSSLLTTEGGKPLTAAKLHKFLSKSWKIGANYVVVEASATSIEKLVFHGLPIHTAVLTDIDADGILDRPVITDYSQAHGQLFSGNPHFIVLNRDAASYDAFATYTSKDATASYGRHRDAFIRIDSTKLYKKGAEASLIHSTHAFQTATFVPGQESAYCMAAATAVAKLLNLPTESIIDGIANYEPKG